MTDIPASGLSIAGKQSWFREGMDPSHELADRFNSVAIRKEADIEERRSLVNCYIEIYHLLERMGWYDHTGDWDFHVGVKLNDGREESHFGDGASVELVRDAADNGERDAPYSGSDDRNFLRIETQRFLDSETYTKPVPHLFDEFGQRDDFQEGGMGVWLIPIELISEIGFGYCT